jgi:hypothetical protein
MIWSNFGLQHLREPDLFIKAHMGQRAILEIHLTNRAIQGFPVTPMKGLV